MSSPFEIQYVPEEHRRVLVAGDSCCWLWTREEIAEMPYDTTVLMLQHTTKVKNLVHKLAEGLKPTLLTPEQEFAIRVMDAQTKDFQRRLERLERESQ